MSFQLRKRKTELLIGDKALAVYGVQVLQITSPYGIGYERLGVKHPQKPWNKAGSVRCNGGGGQCKGAARGYTATGQYWADYCYPHILWANTPGSTSGYYDAWYLNNGGYGTSSWPSTLAFSVAHCVFGFGSINEVKI